MSFWNQGILGINARNLLYIRPYNKKKAIRLADDKIKTKQFLSTREIPVPKMYGMIKTVEELEKYDFNTIPNQIVIKPNNGYGGEGIIVITNKKDGYWITAGGKKLNKKDIKEHIRDILDGRYSISNISDTALFEQYIQADDKIGKFSYEGLPDVRVVVHNLIPVMAMLRLPTRESSGKANLHLGAVGVGIDIAKGQCTHIAYKNRIIEELPDQLGKIRGTQIPYWDEILEIASKAQLITNLGYMAIDIGIDKNTGPVVLEINARAGLGVQIANLAPLRKRLERIEGVKVTNPTKGVRIAKDMFGNTLEKEIAQLSGKKVIGAEEHIEIIQKNGTTKVLAKIDTGEERSIIDEKTAEEAGLLESTKEYNDEKSTLKIKFSLDGKRIQTVVDVEKIPSEKYKMIIGKRDLKDFLVDTSQTKQEEAGKKKSHSPKTRDKSEKKKVNFHEIDQALIHIDSKIKLLYHLRPINLESERTKFLKDKKENPIFEYPQLKFDSLELIDQLHKIKIDNSPLGMLFQAKREEISNKIALIEAIDENEFSKISEKLFGRPTREDVEKAKETVKAIIEKGAKKDREIYNSEEAKERFEKVFKEYGLKNWRVKTKENMVADCVAGKNNRLFVNKDAKFSRERIESLIVHEIETHIITAENGKMQPYELFNRGLADYLITQEGLAVYNVEKQRRIPFEMGENAHVHVVAIDKALESSFIETFDTLVDLGIAEEQAFRSALKAKRGFSDTSKKGAFTKDYIYYKGYHQIKEFVEDGGDIKNLYIGKLNIRDLEEAKKINGLIKPRLLPKWLK